jgi:hypothetical protein
MGYTWLLTIRVLDDSDQSVVAFSTNHITVQNAPTDGDRRAILAIKNEAWTHVLQLIDSSTRKGSTNG